MSAINIQAAQTQLSRLVEEVVARKEIVAGKAGRPMVVLTPWQSSVAIRAGDPLAGQIWEAEDCGTVGEELSRTSGENQKRMLPCQMGLLKVRTKPV